MEKTQIEEPDDEDVFPPRLLRAPAEERKKYFREYQVEHPRVSVIFKKVLRIIHEPGGIQLIFLIGPTGVGKTFLVKWLVNAIETEWSTFQHTDPGRIPVAWMEVPAKDTRNPTWGDFYTRALRSFNERHIEKKIVYDSVAVDVKYVDGQKKVTVEDATIRRLRRALEACARNRRPLIFILDEGHQLINTGGLKVHEQIENVKSLANMTELLLGIFGTYRMLDLLGLEDDEESDQLIRRGALIHFIRYRDTEEERAIFANVIYSFQRNMPFERTPDLVKHSDYLYERTVGCVGILRDWLLAAYGGAVDEGASTLELKHLKLTCRISKARAKKMRMQFEKHERELAEILDDEDEEFKDFLKKPESPSEGKYGPEKDERIDKGASKKRKRNQRKPGRQSPKRRPIGRRNKREGDKQ